MCPPFAISHKKAASNGSIAADRLIFGRPIPSPSLSRGWKSIPDSKALSKYLFSVRSLQPFPSERLNNPTEEFLMASPITLDSWIKHLKEKTGSAECPFCHHQDWEVQCEPDGSALESRILDQSFVKELNDAFLSVADSYESAKKGEDSPPPPQLPPPTYLSSILVVRCKHCGYITLFSRKALTEG